MFYPNVVISAVVPFCKEEAFSLGFVILENVFGGATKVLPPWVRPGCLVGTLAPGKVQLAKSGRM